MTGTQAKESACACRGTEKSEKRGTASGKVPPLPDFACRQVRQRIEKYDINIPKNGKNLFTIWKRCVNMYPVEVGAFALKAGPIFTG